MPLAAEYLLVSAAAAGVGLAELVARYRSDPASLWTYPAAWLYVALNGAAGAGALALIQAFGWFADTDHTELWRGLIAGFGAVAFFRSSLFITKIGGTDVNVGPSLILGALLDACDRTVDRRSAVKIAECASGPAVAGLDPAAVMTALPVLCLSLMQNFAPGDQAQLGAELSKIREQKDLSEDAQMRAVVIQLAKYLGADLVTGVITVMRPILEPKALTPPQLPEPAALLEETKRAISTEAPPTGKPASA